MQKIAETKITTTNGKQYQIILDRYTKGKEPYPFHTSVVTDKKHAFERIHQSRQKLLRHRGYDGRDHQGHGRGMHLRHEKL